jgi:CRP-like cAMP-binding protein
MFMIVSGEAEIYKGQQLMALLGPGEMFGEMALLDWRRAICQRHCPLSHGAI